MTAAAQQGALGTAQGDYLSAGNPYLQNMFGSIANTVTPSVTGAFEGAGRYGSGAYAHALSDALANTAGNLAYQNYSNERGNMMQADALVGDPVNQTKVRYRAARIGGRRAAAIGAAGWQRGGRPLHYNQNLPYNTLANYMRMIQGNYGSSSTQTTQNYANPIAGALSGSARAASIRSA